jgi:hypothetical protein
MTIEVPELVQVSCTYQMSCIYILVCNAYACFNNLHFLCAYGLLNTNNK